MTDSAPGKNAYITLLTRPSYLAGAILLAHSLHTHSPTTPLIVAYTPDTLPESSIQAFRDEAKYSNIILHAVEHLRLPDAKDGTAHGMVAERFIDTWTKLRVFDVVDGWERLCWLDADMMIFSDPSPLVFNAANDAFLQGGDCMRVMAVHTCVCNLDHDSWAPASWTPANCAMAKLQRSADVAEVVGQSETLGNFNSGTFLWRPSAAIARFVHAAFEKAGSETLRAMKFPDQDFLNLAFANRWAALSWRTNALKTWRYWHTNIWRDADVAVLHYIVDKPWAARVNDDGSAGYLGKDGETHKWWWAEFDAWEAKRKEAGETTLLEEVAKYSAGKEGEVHESMRAIGGGAQDYAKKWPQKDEGGQDNGDGKDEGKDGKENLGHGEHGPVLRKKMLGERGHGPVANGRGLGRGEGWCVME
jgi:inositol 3-alpha-galactosyltransferase